MKSAKENTILESIDRHGITLIESKQRFTVLFTCTKQRTRRADDGCKKYRHRHRLLIKLDPASK